MLMCSGKRIFDARRSLHLDDVIGLLAFNGLLSSILSQVKELTQETKKTYQNKIMHLFIPVSLAMFYPPRQLSRLDHKPSSAGQS